MKTLKAKFRRFVKNEDGMEFMQVAVIVLGAILLVAAVWLIYNKVNTELQKIPDQIVLDNPGNG